MADNELTDLSNLSEESLKELRDAIDTPAPKPDPEKKLDADSDSDPDAGEEKKTEKKAEDKTEEKSNILDVEKTPEELEAEKVAAEEAKNDPAKKDEVKPNTLDLIDFNAALKAIEFPVETPITNQEEFNQAIKASIETTKAKAKEELFLEVTEMAGYDPDSQFMLKMIKAGVPVEELKVPGKGFDEVLALSDNDLIVQEMVTGGMDPEQAQLKATELAEDDLLKAEADKLRGILKKDKAEFINNFNNHRKAFVDSRLKALSEKSIAFDKDVVDTIKKTKDFLGYELSDRLKDQIAKKFESQTEYRTRLTNDPKFLADMILKNELLERTVAQIRKDSVTTVKNEEKIKKHEENYNVKDIATQQKSIESSHEGADSFAAWGAIRTQSVKSAT